MSGMSINSGGCAQFGVQSRADSNSPQTDLRCGALCPVSTFPQLNSISSLSRMKLLVALCLLGVALAKAEPEPSYGYNGAAPGDVGNG